MKRITVLLADDHIIVREGFRTLLELEKGLEVVGEAGNGRRAVTLVKKLRPAVVIMDIGMPLLNGLEATRQILEAVPRTIILILSAHTDIAYVKNAMEAGAMGYLFKQDSVHDLCRAIRKVNHRRIFFGPVIVKLLPEGVKKSLNRTGRPNRRASGLTPREMEVLQLIAEGSPNKQAAVELGIGMKTIERHREHLMRKLNIHGTAGLTRYAISTGIIESSVQVTIV